MTFSLPTRCPLVAAPMAGGPTTVELSTAVTKAGAFPFLAAGYKTPAALAEEITALRRHTQDFGVNLFVPSTNVVDRARFAAYAREISEDARGLGVELEAQPVADNGDYWQEKIDLLLAVPVTAVSFTFGLPPRATVRDLQEKGMAVLVTVTNPEEAVSAEEIGVDALVVQGSQAGGHSATFTPEQSPRHIELTQLLAEVRQVTTLSLIAAGGISRREQVEDVLAAGAIAAAVGTVLLRAPEAGTSEIHRHALASGEFSRTVMTRAFTGRPARALENDFVRRHSATAPDAYPAVHHLTKPLRQAAVAAGDAQRVHLWAGAGFKDAVEAPAEQIIRALCP